MSWFSCRTYRVRWVVAAGWGPMLTTGSCSEMEAELRGRFGVKMAESEAVWRMTKRAYGWVCSSQARQIRKKAGL